MNSIRWISFSKLYQSLAVPCRAVIEERTRSPRSVQSVSVTHLSLSLSKKLPFSASFAKLLFFSATPAISRERHLISSVDAISRIWNGHMLWKVSIYLDIRKTFQDTKYHMLSNIIRFQKIYFQIYLQKYTIQISLQNALSKVSLFCKPSSHAMVITFSSNMKNELVEHTRLWSCL